MHIIIERTCQCFDWERSKLHVISCQVRPIQGNGANHCSNGNLGITMPKLRETDFYVVLEHLSGPPAFMTRLGISCNNKAPRAEKYARYGTTFDVSSPSI